MRGCLRAGVVAREGVGSLAITQLVLSLARDRNGEESIRSCWLGPLGMADGRYCAEEVTPIGAAGMKSVLKFFRELVRRPPDLKLKWPMTSRVVLQLRNLWKVEEGRRHMLLHSGAPALRETVFTAFEPVHSTFSQPSERQHFFQILLDSFNDMNIPARLYDPATLNDLISQSLTAAQQPLTKESLYRLQHALIFWMKHKRDPENKLTLAQSPEWPTDYAEAFQKIWQPQEAKLLQIVESL